MKRASLSSLTDFPDYYENNELLLVVKERIKVHIKGLSKLCSTKTREDAHAIVIAAVDISNNELNASIEGIWVPQVVFSLEKNEDGPDVIRLEIRSFCRVGAGLN